MQIFENIKNSFTTHPNFYTLVHMIRVYRAVSRKKIHSNICGTENVGYEKPWNKNANFTLRKSKKVNIKQLYFGSTNFGESWVFTTVDLGTEINGPAKIYASKMYLILLLAKENFKNTTKKFTFLHY